MLINIIILITLYSIWMLYFEINTVWGNWSKWKSLIFKLHEEIENTGFKPCILTIYKPELENKIINLFELCFIFIVTNEEILQDLLFLKKCKWVETDMLKGIFLFLAFCFQAIKKNQSALLHSGSHSLQKKQNCHTNFLHML